mgnify:CR=1 FL=1
MNISCPPLLKGSLAVALVLTFGCTSATAGYAVIDDDLLPTAMAQARQSAGRNEQFGILFVRDRTTLTDASRASLDMLLPRMNQASVRIVGRPDTVVTSREKAAALASGRAASIRDYLARKGIPAYAISVEVASTPNQQATGSPTEVWIGPVAGVASASYERQRPLEVEEFLQTKAPAQANGSNEQLMRYINDALKAGQIEPSVALTLIRSMAPQQAGRTATAQPQYVSPAPQYHQVVYQPVATPTTTSPAPNQWPIRKALSLRQNVEAWARMEGFEVVWELPPTVNAQFESDRYFNAPTFADAIRILHQGLQAKGYRFIAVNLYEDRVVQFTERKTL